MGIPLTNVDTVEIIMKGVITTGGSNSINTAFVFNYRRLSTAVDPTKAAFDAAFQAGPAIPILAALNARWSQTENTVRWVNDALDQALPIAHSNPGAIAGDSMPSHVAVNMLFRTGIKGRSYRGAKHFGPMSETDTTSGGDDLLNAAAITRVQAIATALALTLTDSTTNQWKLCVFSRSLSTTIANPTIIVKNDVATILFNKRLGNMKRRQAKSVY